MSNYTDELVDFDTALDRYDPVLGFEVHVELNTRTKMFDAAPNIFGDEPNTAVTPVLAAPAAGAYAPARTPSRSSRTSGLP